MNLALNDIWETMLPYSNFDRVTIQTAEQHFYYYQGNTWK